jgi:site-specific recombinase XerD
LSAVLLLMAAVLTYQTTHQAERREARKPVPVEQWSKEYVQQLRGCWQDFLQVDLAESTHRAYGWHVRQYRKYCKAAGVREVPDAEMLGQFVVGRAQHGYALSTIEQGVYAVSRWALDLGVEGLAAELEVRRAMKVAAKLAVPSGQQKLPLDRRDLAAVADMLQKRGSWDFLGARDRALFLVGWSGMFRSSELVGISWEDVRERPKGLLLFMPRSKTDQAGEGAWVFIARCAQEKMCPVRAVQRLRRFACRDRDGQPVGAVFTAWEGEPEALAKGTVGVRLRKALEEIGMKRWDLYAAHWGNLGGESWSVGAASDGHGPLEVGCGARIPVPHSERDVESVCASAA